MRWRIPLLVLLSFWAYSAFANVLPKALYETTRHYEAAQKELHNQPFLTNAIENRPAYRQLKHAKTLNRYLWLKDTQPGALTHYSKLNRPAFSHTPPPVSFFYIALFPVASLEYSEKDTLKVFDEQAWTQNPPDSANRLGGWKESNILYKGVVTYHSTPELIL